MRCCWQEEQITPERCPRIPAGEESLRCDRKHRLVRLCLECPRFLEDLQALPADGEGLAPVFPLLAEELLAQRARNQLQQSQLEARAREVKFLHEVSLVLQTSVDMDEVIAMALTAITAGQGFGINRAILMLVDRERRALNGYFAVGPRAPEEATRIWKDLEDQDLTLREMAQRFFERRMAAERERFRDLLQLLSTPLERRDHLFTAVLDSQMSRQVDLRTEPGLDPEQRQALGVEKLVLVPLLSKNRRIGLLLADNIVSGRPISVEDLQSLETFALPMAFAIERASLYERLQAELDRARDANRRLREQQETILRMEKMALVGNLAANLAHSIRNPLTIIGGFARALIRDTADDDPRRRHLESIVRESRRLEEVLQEALAYSESQHPTLDHWDINQLVARNYADLREDLAMAGLDCRLELAADLPLVKLDYKKVGYCLRGLLGSALERVPRGGHLLIATRAAEGSASILLEDDGPELPPGLREAPDNADLSLPLAGPHLAVTLCARILRAHGGRFRIASRPEGGTLFTMSFPIDREEGS